MRWAYESHKLTLFIRSIDSKTNWAEKHRAAFWMRICAPKIFYTELSPCFFRGRESDRERESHTFTWTKQIHDCYSLVTRLSFARSLTRLCPPHWTHLNVWHFASLHNVTVIKLMLGSLRAMRKALYRHKTKRREKCKRRQVIGKCDSFMVRQNVPHVRRVCVRVCACGFGHVFDVFGIHKFQNNALYE